MGCRQKDYMSGSRRNITISSFHCSADLESIYSEVWEAKKFPLGLQCPGALCVLSNKKSDSSVIEKP